MGMSSGGDRKAVKSEINVTPLVDIVLVLLIIFLVLTPVKMRHITLEVPRKLDQDTEVAQPGKQISVLVKSDDTIELSDGSETHKLNSRFDLAKKVRELLDKSLLEKVVFVDFEDPVMYGDAVATMDTIKGAGAEKVALKLRADKQPE